ncbi:MAG: glycosyltransferase [Phycisphaerales bacterium]|nr:glycosyltransferase [Phycisphaerales bacterium]
MPVRVGQLIETVDVQGGGTSTAFLAVLAALRSQSEIQPHAFALQPPSSDPAHADIGAHPREWTLSEGRGAGLRPGSLGRSAAEALAAKKLDVLHVHGLWSPDLLHAGRAALRAGVPLVWQPHGMLVKEAYAQKRLKKEIFMALGMRRVLRAASALVFVTSEERDHSIVPSGIERARQQVVPLPVNMPGEPISAAFRARARERFGLPAADPVIVFLGRFHHVKRVDMAIRALARSKTARLRLLLIGGGDEEPKLRALAAELGITDRVTFGGWVQGEDKWLALAAGDVLTLNSIHENFGYVAVEALCVGTLPLLTSNLAIAKEIGPKTGGGAGVAEVCEPTIDALAAGFDAGIARSRAMSDEQRKIGRSYVDAHLSPNAVGSQLGSMYQTMLKADRLST